MEVLQQIDRRFHPISCIMFRKAELATPFQQKPETTSLCRAGGHPDGRRRSDRRRARARARTSGKPPSRRIRAALAGGCITVLQRGSQVPEKWAQEKKNDRRHFTSLVRCGTGSEAHSVRLHRRRHAGRGSKIESTWRKGDHARRPRIWRDCRCQPVMGWTKMPKSLVRAFGGVWTQPRHGSQARQPYTNESLRCTVKRPAPKTIRKEYLYAAACTRPMYQRKKITAWNVVVVRARATCTKARSNNNIVSRAYAERHARAPHVPPAKDTCTTDHKIAPPTITSIHHDFRQATAPARPGGGSRE